MPQSQTKSNIVVSALKSFTDNYIWVISSLDSNKVSFVDPGDAKVCINYLEKENKCLSSILITHHHPDHTGGIKELVEYSESKRLNIKLIGPDNKKIEGITTIVSEGCCVNIMDDSLTLNVIDLPGHTLDHIAYHVDDILFCGDTLFSGGCGRLFEGTPEQMHNSLTKLANLPARTRVYCAHEYTLANLEFALTVDPTNLELVHYYNQVVSLRADDKMTLPSSIQREKQINPFLRCGEDNIKESAGEFSGVEMTNDVSVFAAIRKWKDNF